MPDENAKPMVAVPAPRFHLVVVRCDKCGGNQELRYDVKGFSIDQVRLLSGLMDGTSPMYVNPPDERSCIGRCGKCGGRFKCIVVPG